MHNSQARLLRSKGFSMTELLVILALLAILGLMLLFGFQRHQGRARDARRKADLDKIKISFEEYYNDNNCYPPPEILNSCNGEELRPYLGQIPCDPFTHQPYVYVPFEGNQCKGYRLLTSLEDEQDPIIVEAGCNTECGCGFGDEYNYGVSAGIPLIGEACSPIIIESHPTPSPLASPPGGGEDASPSPSPASSPTTPPVDSYYACAPDGNCNVYFDPDAAGCPATYPDFSTCQTACATPANRCIE